MRACSRRLEQPRARGVRGAPNTRQRQGVARPNHQGQRAELQGHQGEEEDPIHHREQAVQQARPCNVRIHRLADRQSRTKQTSPGTPRGTQERCGGGTATYQPAGPPNGAKPGGPMGP